jgi:hypothetical protein
MTYGKQIIPESEIFDDREYVVVASYKDGDGTPFVKFRGTYDECAAYADRNESPDNPETYRVHEAKENA